jgi:hypothetical protein
MRGRLGDALPPIPPKTAKGHPFPIPSGGRWKECAVGADDRALEGLVTASATRAGLAALGEDPTELILNAATDHPYSPFIYGQTQSLSADVLPGTPPSSFSFQPME